MPNIPSFSEDMLPRHFPKTKRQLEQNSAVVPVPTLPGVSLILDEENKFPKIEPKKSFQKWKQQHEAMFANNSIEYQGKKQVRFQANNHTDGSLNKRKTVPARLNPPVGSPKLELSFYEPPASQAEHDYRQKQNKPQLQHHNAYTASTVTSQANDFAKFNSKMTHMPNFMHNPTNGLRNIVGFSQFNRALRSEAIKENCSPNVGPVCNDGQLQVQKSNSPHSNGYCCQVNQLSCQPMTNHCHPCSHELPKTNCVHEQRLPPVIEQEIENLPQQYDVSQQTSPYEQQLVNPADFNFEERPTTTLDDDTLMGIMEEQQHHILMQQNQILMQQKQMLMQQNQIFILQHQIEKILLRNGTLDNQSPTANRQHPSSPICDKKTTSPGVMSNALAMRSVSPKPSSNGIKNRTSIGVMTSFVGNLNDGMPNEIRQINDKFTSKTKFTNDRGGIGSGEQSYKDSMLDKINEVIRNSPAVIDYRQTNGTNRRMSPSKPTDINIAAQTLIYETSTSNCNMNDQKTTDRSFALYMLGMKYCPQDDQSGADKRGSNLNENFGNAKRPSSNTDDHIGMNFAPDAYDYFIRHGLLKK